MAVERFPQRVPCKAPCKGKARVKWKYDVRGLPKGLQGVGSSKCPTCGRTALHFAGQPDSPQEMDQLLMALENWSGNEADIHLTNLPERKK
jgi:hypothetical protein